MIVAITLGSFMITSKLSTSHSENAFITNVSLKAGEENASLSYSFLNASKEAISLDQEKLISGVSLVSFSTSYSSSVKNPEIKFNTGNPVELFGIQFASGKTSYSFSNQNIQNNFDLVNAKLTEKFGKLLLSPIKGKEFGLKLKKELEFNRPMVSYTWGGFVAVLCCVLSSISLFYRKLNMQLTILTVFSSFILSFLTFHLLEQLKVKVSNVDLSFELELDSMDDPSFILYYGFGGMFDPSKTLESKVNQVKDKIKFDIPHGDYGNFRLDLPKNSKIKISEFSVDYFLGNSKIQDSEELREKFNLYNDVEFVKNENGELIFLTGNTDPYLVLNDWEFQESYTINQEIKSNYSKWFAFILFGILLLVFSGKSAYKYKLFSACFGILILTPGLTFLLKEDDVSLPEEKRIAFQRPHKMEDPRKFTADLANYLQDQFGGRKQIITTWNLTRILAFGQTNKSSSVIMGKDGWMFYRAEGVQETYENKEPLTEDQLQKMTKTLSDRYQWLAKQGIDYYVVFPPLKHTVYPENLPNHIKVYQEQSKLDQLIEYVHSHSDVKIVDIRGRIFEAKEKEDFPLYYKTDSHWNLLGAYYGYQKLMEVMSADHPELGEVKKKSDFIWKESTSTDGDLALLLSLNEYFIRREIIPVPLFEEFSIPVESKHYPTYESPQAVVSYGEIKKTNRPKLVLNRDSFTNYLIPYLKEHFSASFYLWTPKFNPKIIMEEQPDIVVTEMMERFWSDLLIENPPFPEIMTQVDTTITASN